MSSKKPVGRLREVIQVPKRVSLIELMLFFHEILCCWLFCRGYCWGSVQSLCICFGVETE